MKKLKNSKLGWVVTCFLLALISCKKDKTNSESLVDEVAASLSAYATVPSSDVTLILSNKQIVFDKTQSKGFPVVLSTTSGSNIDVEAKIDYNPKLLQVYDSLFHTKSPILTEGIFAISGKETINIGAGTIQSNDSVKVQLSDVSKLASGTYNFVIPITMTSGSTLLKSKVMFIRYKVTVANISLLGFGVQTNNSGAKFYNLNMPSTIATASGPYVQMMLDKPLAIVSTANIDVINTPEMTAAYSTFSGVSYLPFPAGAYSLSVAIAEFNVNGIYPPAAKCFRILCTGNKFAKGKYLMAVRVKTPNPTVLPIEELIKSPELIYFALTII